MDATVRPRSSKRNVWSGRSLAVLLSAFVLGGCLADDDAGGTSEPSVTPVTSGADATPTATAAEPGPPTAEAEDATADVDDATATPGPEAVEARAIVESFDAGNEDAIHQLNLLAFPDGQPNPADIVPALAPLLEDEDPDRRWAALYVVALATDTPEEIEVLRGALDDPELDYRVQAAGSLAGLGVVEALPVLIEGLPAAWDMPHSDPPLTVSEHARRTLEHYTGESFEDQSGWLDWWEQVRDSIQWDGERYAAG
jgi:hypothetical protein